VKGKVVPVLLTEHHAIKAYWRVEVSALKSNLSSYAL